MSSATTAQGREGELTAKRETPIAKRESFAKERGGRRKRPQGGGGPAKRGAV